MNKNKKKKTTKEYMRGYHAQRRSDRGERAYRNLWTARKRIGEQLRDLKIKLYKERGYVIDALKTMGFSGVKIAKIIGKKSPIIWNTKRILKKHEKRNKGKKRV